MISATRAQAEILAHKVCIFLSPNQQHAVPEGLIDICERELVVALREARRDGLEEAARRLDQEAEDWCEEIAGTFKEAARIVRRCIGGVK